MRKKKPDWDTAIEGAHPALKDLKPDPAELEAARAYVDAARLIQGSPGAQHATAKQKWVAALGQHADFHRSNLKLFSKVGDKKKIDFHNRALATTLMHLGEFHEAMALATWPSGRAKNGYKALAHEIGLLAQACYRPDTPLCNCTRREAEVPHPQLTQTVAIEFDRHQQIGQILSPKHGKVVEIWKCAVCNRRNAHDLGPPPRQQEKFSMRAKLEALPLTPQSELPMTAGDHALLKKL